MPRQATKRQPNYLIRCGYAYGNGDGFSGWPDVRHEVVEIHAKTDAAAKKKFESWKKKTMKMNRIDSFLYGPDLYKRMD